MTSISEVQKAAHPDKPWLWRDDWAEGRIKSSHGIQAIMMTVMAVVFAAFSIPLLLQAPEIARKEGAGVWLMAGLFLLGACGMIYWAMLCVARWARFKEISFELTTCPGVIGGCLEGVVHLGRAIEPSEGFTLRLSCMQRKRTGRNNKSSTIWQDEVTVPSSRVSSGLTGMKIPVHISVPYEAQPSSDDPKKPSNVQWRLEILATLTGTNLHAFFEVPVFKTEMSSPKITEHVEQAGPEAAKDDGAKLLEAETALQRQNIHLTRSPTKGITLFFPARRERIGAMILTLFAVLWNGFIAWAATSVPGLFKLALVPFGLVGLLLVVFVPVVWLQTTTLRAGRDRLTLHRTILGFGRPRHIDATQIESFSPKSQGGNGGRATFSVQLHVRGERPRRLASNLTKPDAQQVCLLLRNALTNA